MRKKYKNPDDIGWNTKAMDKWKVATKANNPFTHETFKQVTEQTANTIVAANDKIRGAMDQKMIDHLLKRDKPKDVTDTFAQEYMTLKDRGIVTYAETAQTKSTTEECLEEVLGQELAVSLAKESIENKIEPVVLLMWIVDNHYHPIE